MTCSSPFNATNPTADSSMARFGNVVSFHQRFEFISYLNISFLSSIKTSGHPAPPSSTTAIRPSCRLSPSSHISPTDRHFPAPTPPPPFSNRITAASR
ncbi:hypothetical protein Hanom_Chr15g01347401 [Helianthus anomalus]